MFSTLSTAYIPESDRQQAILLDARYCGFSSDNIKIAPDVLACCKQHDLYFFSPYDLPPGLIWEKHEHDFILTFDKSVILKVDEDEMARLQRLKHKHDLTNTQKQAIEAAYTKQTGQFDEGKVLSKKQYYGLIDTILSNPHLADEDKKAQKDCVAEIVMTEAWVTCIQTPFTSDQLTPTTGAIQFFHPEMDVSSHPKDLQADDQLSVAELWRYLVTKDPKKRQAISDYVKAYQAYDINRVREQCYGKSVHSQWSDRLPGIDVLEKQESDITTLKAIMRHLIHDYDKTKATFPTYTEFYKKYKAPNLKRADIVSYKKNKNLFTDTALAWQVEHRLPVIHGMEEAMTLNDKQAEWFATLERHEPQDDQQKIAYWQNQVAKQYQHFRGHLAFLTEDVNFLSANHYSDGSEKLKQARERRHLLNACELPYGGIANPVWDTCQQKSLDTQIPCTLYCDYVMGPMVDGPLRERLRHKIACFEAVIRGTPVRDLSKDSIASMVEFFRYEDKLNYDKMQEKIHKIRKYCGAIVDPLLKDSPILLPDTTHYQFSEVLSQGMFVHLIDNLLDEMQLKNSSQRRVMRTCFLAVFKEIFSMKLRITNMLAIKGKVQSLFKTMPWSLTILVDLSRANSSCPDAFASLVGRTEPKEVFNRIDAVFNLGRVLRLCDNNDGEGIGCELAFPSMVNQSDFLFELHEFKAYRDGKLTWKKIDEEKENLPKWSVARGNMKQFFDLMGQYGKQTQVLTKYESSWHKIVETYCDVEAGRPMINKLFNEGILTKDEKNNAISRHNAIYEGKCPIDVLTDDRLRHMEGVVNRLLMNIWYVDTPQNKADKAYAFATRFGSRIDTQTAKILGDMSYGPFFMTANNLDDFFQTIVSSPLFLRHELAKDSKGTGHSNALDYRNLIKVYQSLKGMEEDKKTLIPWMKKQYEQAKDVATENTVAVSTHHIQQILDKFSTHATYAVYIRPMIQSDTDVAALFKDTIEPLIEALSDQPALLQLALQDANKQARGLDQPLMDYLKDILATHSDHAQRKSRLTAAMRFYRQKARGLASFKAVNSATDEAIVKLNTWHQQPPYCSLDFAKKNDYNPNVTSIFDFTVQASTDAMARVQDVLKSQTDHDWPHTSVDLMEQCVEHLKTYQSEFTTTLQAALKRRGGHEKEVDIANLARLMVLLGRCAVQPNKRKDGLEGQALNSTQIMAVITMLEKPETRPHILAQIDTGQGKSRICAVLSAYCAWKGKGHVVDYFTNYALGTRWANEYAEFFEVLGMPCQCVHAGTPPDDLIQNGPAIRVSDEQLWLKQQIRRLHHQSTTTDTLIADEGDLLLRNEPVYTTVEAIEISLQAKIFFQAWQWMHQAENKTHLESLSKQWQAGEAFEGESFQAWVGACDIDDANGQTLLKSLLVYKTRKVQSVAMPIDKTSSATRFMINDVPHTLCVLDQGVSHKQLGNWQMQWMWAQYWVDHNMSKASFTCPPFVKTHQQFMRPDYQNSFYLTGSAANTGRDDLMLLTFPKENRRGYALLADWSQEDYIALEAIEKKSNSAGNLLFKDKTKTSRWTHCEIDQLIQIIHDDQSDDLPQEKKNHWIQALNQARAKVIQIIEKSLWQEGDTIQGMEDKDFVPSIVAAVKASQARGNPCLITLDDEQHLAEVKEALTKENLWDDGRDWCLDAVTNHKMSDDQKMKKTNAQGAGATKAVTLSTVASAGRGFDIRPAKDTCLEVVCGMRTQALSLATQRQVHGRTRRGTTEGLVRVIVSDNIAPCFNIMDEVTKASLANYQHELLAETQCMNQMKSLQTFWRDKFAPFMGETQFQDTSPFPDWPGIDSSLTQQVNYFKDIKQWLAKDLSDLLGKVSVTDEILVDASKIVADYHQQWSNHVDTMNTMYHEYLTAKAAAISGRHKNAEDQKNRERSKFEKGKILFFRRRMYRWMAYGLSCLIATGLAAGAYLLVIKTSLFQGMAPIMQVISTPVLFYGLLTVCLGLMVFALLLFLIKQQKRDNFLWKQEKKSLQDVEKEIAEINKDLEKIVNKTKNTLDDLYGSQSIARPDMTRFKGLCEKKTGEMHGNVARIDAKIIRFKAEIASKEEACLALKTTMIQTKSQIDGFQSKLSRLCDEYDINDADRTEGLNIQALEWWSVLCSPSWDASKCVLYLNDEDARDMQKKQARYPELQALYQRNQQAYEGLCREVSALKGTLAEQQQLKAAQLAKMPPPSAIQ